MVNAAAGKEKETRDAFLTEFPSASADGLVKGMSHLYAGNKKNVARCQKVLKDYINPTTYDDPKWTLDWYVNLSACQILSAAHTRVQEEADFRTWLTLNPTKGITCDDMLYDAELKKACKTPLDFPSQIATAPSTPTSGP